MCTITSILPEISKLTTRHEKFLASHRISEKKGDKMCNRKDLCKKPLTYGTTIAAPPRWGDHVIYTSSLRHILRLDHYHSACENSYLTLPNETEESFQ
jgi:hypothetical protein